MKSQRIKCLDRISAFIKVDILDTTIHKVDREKCLHYYVSINRNIGGFNMENIIAEIIEKRKKDIEHRGFSFGYEIPEKRTRPINKFMERRGVILEVKRASPSKGDIAPNLNPVETALKYKENGAAAISCLTEENYFNGSLKDLMEICNAIPDIAVLRKDFLIDEEEIEISFRCGADAVLLISGILPLEKMLSMIKKCHDLKIRAFVEVRTNDDARKVLEAKKLYADTIVCGVNSRNLKDFSIDLLVPAMLKNRIGGDVIFESGITTRDAARKVSSMGFSGILLGEFAARNPEKAGDFVRAFENSKEDLYGKKILELAEKINNQKKKVISRASMTKFPLIKICGLTRPEDVLLADSLGADFVGFIFAKEFSRTVWGYKFEEIKKILSQVKALKIAVVTNPLSQEAQRAAEYVEDKVLDFVQFHGIDYNDVPDKMMEVPHYFAITEKMGNMSEIAKKLNAFGESRFLLDSKNHNYGTSEHLWIAGGLNAENIRETIAKFNPELVDVSSGIEDENQPGIKNPEKMKRFFSQAGRIIH